MKICIRAIFSIFLLIVTVASVCACSVKEEIVIDVKRPQTVTDIYAADFGVLPEKSDNSTEFQAMLNYASANAGTRIVLEAETYYFSPTAQLTLTNAQDVLIEGNGAELIFSNGNYFATYNCDRVEFRDFVVDWNDSVSRLASVVKIDKIIDSTHFEATFTELDSVPENECWLTLNPLDPETLTPGCAGVAEIHTSTGLVRDGAGTHLETIEGNRALVTHNGLLTVVDGVYYLVRHRTYLSGVFSLYETQNITVDSVKIYGAHGVGAYTSDGTGHIQFLNFTIGLRPGTENKRRVSTSADGLHLANTSGNILIDNCDISFAGDDCVNINTHVGYITSIEGDVLTVSTLSHDSYRVDDEIYFLKRTYTDPDITAKITAVEEVDNLTMKITVKDLTKAVRGGYIVCSKRVDGANYVIRNSYFHENRARGLLLQSDNGVVKNCRFYKTQGCAILISVDIGESWMEGTGVDNLNIYNNTFEDCDVCGWGGVILARGMMFGELLNLNTFTDIKVVNNTFINNIQALINIQSPDVVISNNTVVED